MKAPGVASHAEEREKNIFVVAGDAIELPLADLSESKYRQEEILFFSTGASFDLGLHWRLIILLMRLKVR